MAINNAINSPTAGFTAAGGAISINSGTAAYSLSTDASATTVNIATGGAVKTTTVGSVNSTSATTVQSGSGALNVTATNGALTVNSGTGALGISTDASNTTLNIGTGGAVKTVTLGSTNGASVTNLQAGSAGIKIPAFAEGALVTSSAGVISTVTGTAGFVLKANAAGTAPSFQSAGTSALSWSVITANQSAVANNGYICNKASTLVLTLPATGTVGDTISVTGINTATGWQFAQNAGQIIHFGAADTTTGVTGSLTSSLTRDTVTIVCVVAGASAEWNVISSIGNPTLA